MFKHKLCSLRRLLCFFDFHCWKERYIFIHDYFLGEALGRQPLKGRAILPSIFSIRSLSDAPRIVLRAAFHPLPIIPLTVILTDEMPSSSNLAKVFLAASWAAQGVAFLAPLYPVAVLELL